MKKRFLYFGMPVVLVTWLLAGCQQSGNNGSAMAADSFHLQGQIAGLDAGWIYLQHVDTAGNAVMDSARVTADSFRFSGVQAEPALYTLLLKGPDRRSVRFFLDNAEIKLSGSSDSLSQADITGSATQDDYQTYLNRLKPINAQIDSLGEKYEEAYGSKNSSLMDVLNKKYDELDSIRKVQITQYIKVNPASVVSAWAVTRNFLFSPDAAELTDLYGVLDPSIKNTSYGKKIKHALDIAEKLAIGKPAPDFTQNDAEGKPVSLSGFKGKFVLVDFWASWCGPCRAENPNVVRAYNKYKNKNFTIVGVSLDEDKAAWQKAIKHDQLNWTQVSDLKGWKNAVAQQYGIRAIPANILIDDHGIIVGHDLRGQKLEDKLAEVLH